MQTIQEVITASFLFAGLSEEDLQRLVDISVEKEAKKGTAIFFEGEPADGFYMLTRGKVKIYKMSLEGREQILHIFGPGEPFGEVPVFHGRPFPASAMTIEDSRTLYFPRREFAALMAAQPSLAMNMLATLSLRLRRFTTQIENLSLKEVPGRLASHLVYLAEEQGRFDLVTLDIPKGQLANLLGTVPETLSRIFAKMSDQGLIRVEGKTIHLLDMERLEELG
ncbi:MAG: transcriptional regulator [Deltaproteobacteria bacterium]|nr:MAG: transcriptional regulator [Deltaproteobacteria bacterium]